MGFVLVEEREVFGTTGEWHHVERFHAKMHPACAKSVDVARKATGLALVIAAHILAIAILQFIRTEPSSHSEAKAMIVTNVPSAQSIENQPPEVLGPQDEPVRQPESQSESAEWLLAKIRVPAEAAPPASPTTSTSAPVRTAALPPAASGLSAPGYDPYAGVAPLRQTAGPAMATPVAGDGLRQPTTLALGERTMERLEIALRRRAKDDRGSATFSATVAADGAVVRVSIVSTTLGDQARILLIEEVHKLRFPPGSNRMIAGTIDLG
jgi:hypothetical protein